MEGGLVLAVDKPEVLRECIASCEQLGSSMHYRIENRNESDLSVHTDEKNAMARINPEPAERAGLGPV